MDMNHLQGYFRSKGTYVFIPQKLNFVDKLSSEIPQRNKKLDGDLIFKNQYLKSQQMITNQSQISSQYSYSLQRSHIQTQDMEFKKLRINIDKEEPMSFYQRKKNSFHQYIPYYGIKAENRQSFDETFSASEQKSEQFSKIQKISEQFNLINKDNLSLFDQNSQKTQISLIDEKKFFTQSEPSLDFQPITKLEETKAVQIQIQNQIQQIDQVRNTNTENIGEIEITVSHTTSNQRRKRSHNSHFNGLPKYSGPIIFKHGFNRGKNLLGLANINKQDLVQLEKIRSNKNAQAQLQRIRRKIFSDQQLEFYKILYKQLQQKKKNLTQNQRQKLKDKLGYVMEFLLQLHNKVNGKNFKQRIGKKQKAHIQANTLN